ncbi:Putative integral membrane protein [Croceitalea dokdonensis DOKDO 023]|uniref:Probable membrane transporter protein n=2 Tax=Croceitalea TaxID=574891 RepID=A0A0P7AZ79_9FLAO|nr:Putative integral membrane protein [Croceitalea dokdonensis DOKDO 023]
MVMGILIGVVIGKDMPEHQFKIGMVLLIIISLAIIVYWDRRKSQTVPTHWSFAGGTGVLAGISTMVGNLAGAFTNLFFLAMRLPKNEFVGTAAWLFLLTNLFKLPFHALVWKTISTESLLLNLRLLPAMGIGLWVGVQLVKRINQKQYRRFIIIVTFIGALAILFR